MEPPLIVVGGVIGALLVFAAMLLGGVQLIRLLKLPQDLPEGARYSPPAPPLALPGNREVARATAALQARRRHLYHMAHDLHGAGDGLIADLPLDPVALDRAEAALRTKAADDAPTAQMATATPAADKSAADKSTADHAGA